MVSMTKNDSEQQIFIKHPGKIDTNENYLEKFTQDTPIEEKILGDQAYAFQLNGGEIGEIEDYNGEDVIPNKKIEDQPNTQLNPAQQQYIEEQLQETKETLEELGILNTQKTETNYKEIQKQPKISYSKSRNQRTNFLNPDEQKAIQTILEMNPETATTEYGVRMTKQATESLNN